LWFPLFKWWFFIIFWLYFFIFNKRHNFFLQPDIRQHFLKLIRIPEPSRSSSILYIHQLWLSITGLLGSRSFQLLFFLFFLNNFLEIVIFLVLHVAHWVIMIFPLLPKDYFCSFVGYGVEFFYFVDDGSVFISELHNLQLLPQFMINFHKFLFPSFTIFLLQHHLLLLSLFLRSWWCLI